MNVINHPEFHYHNLCLAIVFILYTCALSALGCHSDVEGRQTFGVQGKVTLDGQPLKDARIIFISRDEKEEVVSIAPIQNGEFKIPPSKGPVAGMALVKIESDTIEVEEYEHLRDNNPKKSVNFERVKIPARYNTKSELVADIGTISADNVVSFSLTSR